MTGEFFEHYPKYHYFVASSQLVLAMLSMGLQMRPRDFSEIVLEPVPMLVGVGYQLVVIPLLTALLVALVSVPPEIAVGLFLIAALPGGSMSNIYTFLGKGNAALSVALTGVTTLLALFTAPLILRIFVSDFLPDQLVMPVAPIMREIFLFLVLPLVVGMGLGRLLAPMHAAFLSRWLLRACLLVLALLVLGSFGSGHIEAGSYGWRIPALILLYCLVIQIFTLRTSLHLLKFPLRDSCAIGIESCMKNINLGLLVAASLFRLEGPEADFGGGVLFVLFFYGGVSLIVSAAPALYNYRAVRRERVSTAESPAKKESP